MVPKNETVNRQNYLQMLKNYFYPTMQKRLNNKMMARRPTFPKFVHGSTKNLMEGRLVEVVQFLGHHTLQLQCRLIFFFYGDISKQKSTILPI